MKNLIFLILLCFISTTFAKEYVATAVSLRGNVTQLRPGAFRASTIKLGDKFFEDTSILTGAKSFIRLKYIDGSTSNLGPNSKMVINKIDKKGTSILSLLNGRMRVNVNKKLKKKRKLVLSTRSAAMGIRGTEFSVIYHPKMRTTALLTFDGKVEMAKVMAKSRKNIALAENKIEATFVKENIVVVEPGQYSGTIGAIKKPTQPINISPTQVNALYSNDTWIEKDADKVTTNKNLVKTRVKIVKQKLAPEGVWKPQEDVISPKAGGILDVNTGLYIAPLKNAMYDKKYGVFESSGVGDYDSETGQYIPPKGLDLIPGEGFVPIKKTKKNLLVSRLLNKSLDIYQPADEVVKESKVAKYRYLSDKELMSKDSFIFTIMPGSQDLEITGDGASYTLNSSKHQEYNLTWKMPSSSRFRPLASFSFYSTRFNDNTQVSFTDKSSDMMSMSVGMNYYLGRRWRLSSTFNLRQKKYITYSDQDSTDPTTKKLVTHEVDFWATYFLASYTRFKITLDGGLRFVAPKTKGLMELDATYGYFGGASMEYWITRALNIGLQATYSAESTDYKDDSRTLSLSRTSLGTGFFFGYHF